MPLRRSGSLDLENILNRPTISDSEIEKSVKNAVVVNGLSRECGAFRNHAIFDAVVGKIGGPRPYILRICTEIIAEVADGATYCFETIRFAAAPPDFLGRYRVDWAWWGKRLEPIDEHGGHRAEGSSEE